jgi:hypothetical protein
MLNTVISGAQIGADIAGLRAAHACGITTGGTMPRGFRTLDGPLPLDQVEMFGLVDTEAYGYQVRTHRNVVTADATMRLAHNWHSPGEKLTKRFIDELGRPFWDVTLKRNQEGAWSVEGYGRDFEYAYAYSTSKWIEDQGIEILNVAGNSDKSIEPFVEWFLTVVFTALKNRGQVETAS